ncbi:MAG: serine hydrolase domain-containing protein [Chloroflexota bacterium]
MSEYSLELEKILAKGFQNSIFPGVSILIRVQDEIEIQLCHGKLTYDDDADVVSNGTLFDIASITKLFSSVAIMQLHEKGFLNIYDPVKRFFGQLKGAGKDQLNLWHILTHTSGYDSFDDQELAAIDSKDDLITKICMRNLKFMPGAGYCYSDLGFILLGLVIELVSGKNLDEYLYCHIFEPLGMYSTFYLPGTRQVVNVAPTERDSSGNFLQGVVHDEKARLMGGIAAHSGLFSTATDLGKFSQSFLSLVNYQSHKLIMLPETARIMVEPQIANIMPSQGLGWFINLPFMGKFASQTTFGHTGFTGVSCVIDSQKQITCVLLSNCVHPTRPDMRKREVLMHIRQEISNFGFELYNGVHRKKDRREKK